jgi:hypothetical protein
MTARGRTPAVLLVAKYVGEEPMPEISAVITALIIDRPLCVDCIALRAQVSVPTVKDYLPKVGSMARLQHGVEDRCRACGHIGDTFSLSRVP